MDHLIHIPKDGERIDSLAWHYYGDAANMEPILRANPGLFGRLAAEAGPPIIIPIIEAPPPPPAPGLPPWRT
jgi:phage tail protein X